MSRPSLGRLVARVAVGVVIGVGVAGGVAPPRARADDDAARARFVVDRDAKALLARLAASPDAGDRAWLPLARLAAEPAARAAADDPSALARVVDALRVLDLARARAGVPALATEGVAGAWVEALVAGRGGQDEAATRRLLDAGVPDVARDAFALALLSAALPRDDRDLLAGLVRGALVRAGAGGRLDPVARLAAASAAFDPAAGPRALVLGARILRRGGVEREAAALLDRADATAPRSRSNARWRPWRRGDGAAARASVAAVRPPAPWGWAFDALRRATTAPSVVPAPALTVSDGVADADAAALARALAVLGAPQRADDLATRARQRGRRAPTARSCARRSARPARPSSTSRATRRRPARPVRAASRSSCAACAAARTASSRRRSSPAASTPRRTSSSSTNPTPSGPTRCPPRGSASCGTRSWPRRAGPRSCRPGATAPPPAPARRWPPTSRRSPTTTPRARPTCSPPASARVPSGRC